MAADEHQRQDVVVDPVRVDVVVDRRVRHRVGRQQRISIMQGGPAADRVDRPPPGRGHQPTRRIRRSSHRP
ncbi:hypothetical protein [Catellatospora citrea]|uniref:hypothetical protein n=1 Tax=Catellatospora citrea TaxID=53366 RepID=UPI003458C348